MSEAKTEITPEMIADVAKFLCRECSCQVKELNPGVDLLFVADWRDYFDRIYEGKEPVPMPVMTTATFGTSFTVAKTSEAPPVKAVEVQPIKSATPAESQANVKPAPEIKVVTIEAP